MAKRSHSGPGNARLSQLSDVSRGLVEQRGRATALSAATYSNAAFAASAFPPAQGAIASMPRRQDYRPGQRGPGAPIMGVMPPDLDDAKRPSLVEFGAPGVAIIAGIVQDGGEYNQDLTWKQYIRIIDKMRRSEPTLQQTELAVNMPQLAALAKIVPGAPDPQYVEQASFIETCMFHDLEQSWADVRRESLLYRPYGFYYFEIVYKIEDGMVKWQKFAPRMPKTIWRWWEGPDKELVGIQQFTWDSSIQNYAYINIPASKLLMFTYRQEGNNYEGFSALRPVYKPWWQKQAFEKLQAVGFEREHVGIPTVSLPDGYTDGDITRAKQIGKNVRSSEVGYVILPPGWGFEWAKSRSPEKKGGGISDAIRYLDLQMQNAYLTGFLSLGQSGTGSYAASTDQSMLLLKLCQTDQSYQDEVISRDAIQRLVRYNYGRQPIYPRYLTQNIQAYSLKDITKSISEAITAGAARPTVELEDFLYQLWGAPRPPANLVESTAPGEKGGSRLKPDETGLTPLPLTPEEEIAVANRQTRDIQRISTEKTSTIGTASDSGNKPRLGGSQRSGEAKPKSASGDAGADTGSLREMPDPYARYLSEGRNERPISPAQYQIYTRMAREVGRPVTVLRGAYEFQSHPLALTERPIPTERLLRRRDVASEIADGIREHTAGLRDEITAAVREYVDQRVEESGDGGESGDD